MIRYGAEIQPYAVLVTSIACLPLVIGALFFHHRYERIQIKVMKNDFAEKETPNEGHRKNPIHEYSVVSSCTYVSRL